MLRVKTGISGVQGSPYLSTMMFGAGSSVEAAQDCADAVRAFWAAIVASMVSPALIQVDPEVEEVSVTTGDITTVYSTTTAALNATGSGDPLPWQTQALIRWRTGAFAGGREIRGRTFIPALTEGHSTGGKPSGALLTILNDAANTLRAVEPDGGQGLGVYSKTHHDFADVVSSSAWTEWSYLQSRRL